MAKKFVLSVPNAVSEEKADCLRHVFADRLSVSPECVLVLTNGVTVTVVEIPDPPPPAKTLKVTPPKE